MRKKRQKKETKNHSSKTVYILYILISSHSYYTWELALNWDLSSDEREGKRSPMARDIETNRLLD